jgi:hypothetical protein
MLNARLLPTDRVVTVFALTAISALRRLTNESSAAVDFSRKILYPVFADGSVELRAAWQLRARTDRHDLRPAGIVDAATGDVFLRYNDVQFDQVSGTINGLVLPAYWNDPPQSWVQRHQRVVVTDQDTVYSDTSGYYSLPGLMPGSYPMEGELRGLFANVNNDAPNGLDACYEDTATTGNPLNYSWNYAIARQDEASTYYHTNLIHDWFKVLDSQYDALD